jgi:hypothetical protein
MNYKYLFVAWLFILAGSKGYSQTGQPIYRDASFIDSVLQHHNIFRSALRLPPLTWSADLASDALVWAKKLAKINKGQHDPDVRGKEGENIWWGSAGAFSSGFMVDSWASERQDFVYGVFPDCRTGRSAVVGHYTQMVWKNTLAVGCALVSNGKMDYLVCRYSPPGNIIGEKPY